MMLLRTQGDDARAGVHVTEALPATRTADDASLLNLVRAGDTAAFRALFQRHEPAARRLAGELTSSPAEVDGLVSETFALVLAITQRGGGPADAFRPYILTALRRVHADRLRYRQNLPPADDRLLQDPGAILLEDDLAGLADGLIVRAFTSLPGRWCAVLWHLEIERAVPAAVAPLFGLTRNSVTALSRRAKAGLRQAYLQLYSAGLTAADCQPAAERLGAFITDSLSARETGEVSGHLAGCENCRAACAELADLSTTLRASVGPAFLGAAAAAYLAGASEAAAVPASPVAARAATETAAPTASEVPGDAAPGAAAGLAAAVTASPEPAAGPQQGILTGSTAGAGSAPAGPADEPGSATAGGDAESLTARAGGADGGGIRGGWPELTDWAAWAARPSRWIAASAAAALIVVAIAVAVVLTHRGEPGGQDAQFGVRLTPSSAATMARPPAQLSPASTPVPARRHRKKPVASASGPAGGTIGQPIASPQAAAAQLAAAISVTGSGQRHRAGDVADYTVSDTGAVATGTVTVTITMPGGSWALAGWPHRGGAAGGWACQPAAAGVTCQHAAIAAGSQAAGVLFIGVTSSAACGQPIQITASSGGATASGQSQGIPC
jgi:DNA-directed RNA polymerase specialized sigma24 family protein